MEILSNIPENQNFCDLVVLLYPQNRAFIEGQSSTPETIASLSTLVISGVLIIVGTLSLFIILLLILLGFLKGNYENITLILIGLIFPFAFLLTGIAQLIGYFQTKDIGTKAKYILLGTVQIIRYHKGTHYVRYNFENPHSGEMIHGSCPLSYNPAPRIQYDTKVAVLYADCNHFTLL